MLMKALQLLEELARVDTTLIGKDLGNVTRHWLEQGWIAPIGYLSHISLPDPADNGRTVTVEVAVHEQAQTYSYQNPARPGRTAHEPVDDIVRYRFKPDALMEHLAEPLGNCHNLPLAHSQICLIPGHLWHLGDAFFYHCDGYLPTKGSWQPLERRSIMPD